MDGYTEFKYADIEIGDKVVALKDSGTVNKRDIGLAIRHIHADNYNGGCEEPRGIGIYFGRGERNNNNHDNYWCFDYDTSNINDWIKLYKKASQNKDIMQYSLKSLEGVLPDVYGRKAHKKWLENNKTIV